MANEFGKTWWGAEWLKALSKIDYSNRLPRGASYARKGSVKSIDISGNQIKARVAGSRPTPYKITISVPSFKEDAAKKFMSVLAKKPALISKLLNRELAPGVSIIAEKQGLKVFPTKWSDLDMECSCPDWAVPCKHLAAVIYKVSMEIDNNPFLIFSLHNLNLLAELDKMKIVIKKETIEIPNFSDLLFEKTAKKQNYDTEKAYQKLNFAKIPAIFAPLTALLAPSPAFYVGKSDFKEKYIKQLSNALKPILKYTSGKANLAEIFPQSGKNEKLLDIRNQLKVNIDEQLKVSVEVDGQKQSFPQTLTQLAQIKPSRIYDYQPNTAALFSTFHLAIQLFAKGAMVPQIIQLPNKHYAIRWLPAILSKEVKALVMQLAEMVSPDLLTWTGNRQTTAINKQTETQSNFPRIKIWLNGAKYS
ncbi:MAG: SWIM zinc finger family protein [Bacteroidia bacterium]